MGRVPDIANKYVTTYDSIYVISLFGNPSISVISRSLSISLILGSRNLNILGVPHTHNYKKNKKNKKNNKDIYF